MQKKKTMNYRKGIIGVAVSAFLFGSCTGTTPDPISTVSATFDSTDTEPYSSTTPERSATFTPFQELTPIPWKSPTPDTLYGYPTPEPAAFPTCDPFEGCMLNLTPDVQQQVFAFNELYVGKYVLRNWCNHDEDFPSMGLCGVTISSTGTEQKEYWGYPARLGKETGADLNGNGLPEIVIINWPGGNCCVEVIVMEAGDQLKMVMDIGSYRVGTFIDLNGDGIYEYIAPYRNFSRSFSRCTLWTSVVYEYDPVKGNYVPATEKYKDVLADRIKWASDFLVEFVTENPEVSLHFLSSEYYLNPGIEDEAYLKFESDNSDYSLAVNALYELVAYYLLIGEQENAQNVLDTYFSPEQADEYMLAIRSDVERFLTP